MSSPLLRWIVLGFACLWFGMLVPVHRRGQIQLPGVNPASAADPLPTHCTRAGDANSPCHKKQQQTNDPQEGQPAPARNCAVCHYIVGLHAPPPSTVYVARLGLLRELAAEEPALLPLRHAALPFHGLDPPVA